MTLNPAIVATEPTDGKAQWHYEQIQAPRQPKGNELLVRVIAAGICHTDIFVASLPSGVLGLKYPKILGHEGAGKVEAVGPNVTVAKPGDSVLLSYNYCATCELCNDNRQSYCENFNVLNTPGEENLFQTSKGEPCAGKFFGQSSFASLTIVDEKSVVNVTNLIQTPEELKRCAPLGCGLMTGTGTVLNNLKPTDILMVTGVGAVGAGAIMTAKIIGCKAIIAIDRVASRLETAKELGATHVYDTSMAADEGSFVEDVRALVGGQRIAFAIETTGVIAVMEKVLRTLGKRGKLIQIGVPDVSSSLSLLMEDFYFNTKIVEVNYLGDAKAQDLVPKMIKWYKEGIFPIDKIIKFYRAEDVHSALEDMKTGVIKPVLKF